MCDESQASFAALTRRGEREATMADPRQSTTPTPGHKASPPRLALRPKDAAKALGIGERKLWEITADRTSGIPHVRFGRAVVYPVDELRRWLAAQSERKGGNR